jgi:hypothetical protein
VTLLKLPLNLKVIRENHILGATKLLIISWSEFVENSSPNWHVIALPYLLLKSDLKSWFPLRKLSAKIRA